VSSRCGENGPPGGQGFAHEIVIQFHEGRERRLRELLEQLLRSLGIAASARRRRTTTSSVRKLASEQLEAALRREALLDELDATITLDRTDG
jgi:hypothetical protein